jgi:hypothetical protein
LEDKLNDMLYKSKGQKHHHEKEEDEKKKDDGHANEEVHVHSKV